MGKIMSEDIEKVCPGMEIEKVTVSGKLLAESGA